jgi:hypothetical protein
MASFVKLQPFVADVFNGAHDFSSDTVKAYLSATAPPAGTGNKPGAGDGVEISSGNGYPAGGVTVTVTSSTQTSGTYNLNLTDVVDGFTATGVIPTWRYVILYNDTSTGDRLIGYYDIGQNTDMVTDDTFSITWTNPVITFS